MDLEIIQTDKGEYIAARKSLQGQATKTLLPELLKSLVLELSFPKSMKWSDLKIRFARPIEWFLAMADSEVVEFEIEGMKSSNHSKGHRFFGKEFTVNSVEDYFDPETGELCLGDIVISIDKVYEQAQEYGHAPLREFAFLVAHSMLHLLGYDHMEPDEAEVMEAKQEEILTKLGITR